MLSEIYAAMKKYENDSGVELVIFKGSGKVFCAGGDVVKTIQSILSGHWSFGARFYKRQLALDLLLGTFKKPLVFFINGVVMGGGSGLSMNGTFRVVTENTIFAVPEVSIGLFPDVGASYFLNKLPGCYGLYLGLTGVRIDGAEMLECGLATHYVLSKDLHLLENALCELDSSDASSIHETINKFSHRTPSRLGDFKGRLEIINKCFSRTTVEDILIALEKETECGASRWIGEAIARLKAASPSSVKVALRSSVRAMLFEKDKKKPGGSLQNYVKLVISEEMVDKILQVLEDDEEWEPLELPPITRLPSKATISKL